MTSLTRTIFQLVDRLKYDVLGIGASRNYRRVEENPANELSLGWQTRSIADRQDQAYQRLLKSMYKGHPRRDLQVAAELIDQTGTDSPRTLEIGCGSGYYNEVFDHLCSTDVEYIGSDFSRAMIEIARANYPHLPFVIGDASALSFRTSSVDIAFNGNALMHIPDFRTSIAECARVTRDWAVFHSVPVMRDAGTTALTKEAYGGETIEIIFGESELMTCFDDAGLFVVSEARSIDYRPPQHLLPEPPEMLSYLCRVG